MVGHAKTDKVQLKIENSEHNAALLRVWFVWLAVGFLIKGLITGSYIDLWLLVGAWVTWWIVWFLGKIKTNKNMPI